MKTAIVTGAGRGIGRATAVRLAGPDVTLIINYNSSSRGADETAELCREKGAEVVTVQADVSKASDCDRLVSAALEKTGRIDVLVNNAGITRDGLLMRMSEEDFDAVLDTNLKGAFLCMKAACRPMMKQRFGRIICLSSIVGLRGNAGQANYAASKAGLIGMSKSFAKELAARGITVNLVAPGFIETDMTAVLPEKVREGLLSSIPMGKLGQAEDVARAAVFFAQPDASYITGQVLCVDGGMAV